MDLEQAVAARIRELRTHRGLTQAELARRMGITEGNVSRLETGGRAPSLRTIARVAAALGVEPAELLTRGDVATSAGQAPYVWRICSALEAQPAAVQEMAAAVVDTIVARVGRMAKTDSGPD